MTHYKKESQGKLMVLRLDGGTRRQDIEEVVTTLPHVFKESEADTLVKQSSEGVRSTQT